MKFCRYFSVFLLSCLLLSPGHTLIAQTEGNRAVIDILTLQHRDPSQVRSQIRQHLDPRGHIGQIDNKLVIATTAANLQELQSLINQIDVPPRRLVVSVDFDFNNGSADSQLSVQALESEALQLAQSALSVAEEPAPDAPEQTSTDAEPVDEPPSSPTIWLQADIRDDRAQLLLELLNVAGFSGRHPLTLDLGVWTPLNQTDTLADPEQDPQTEAELATEPAPVIAIRVDVLP